MGDIGMASFDRNHIELMDHNIHLFAYFKNLCPRKISKMGSPNHYVAI